jgi:hypothetical protein
MLPKIELKKIKLLKSLSEETPAYTADLYVDGKLLGHVSNHGQGGCDEFHGPKGMAYNVAQQEYDRVNAIVKAGPRLKSEYFADGLENDLEIICHEQVWEEDFVKTVKRDLAGKVMFTKTDGKLYSIKSKGAEQRQLIDRVLKTKADVKMILNDLPLHEAVAVYKAQ